MLLIVFRQAVTQFQLALQQSKKNVFSQNYWIALVNASTNNSLKANIALETEIGYGDEWVSFRLYGFVVSCHWFIVVMFNHFSPVFKMSILLADSHTVFLMGVLRIWCYIKTKSLTIWFSLFLLPVCLMMCRYFYEK